MILSHDGKSCINAKADVITTEKSEPKVGIKFNMNARKAQRIAKSRPIIFNPTKTKVPVASEIKNLIERYLTTSSAIRFEITRT